jgi:hypothetical protein
LLEELQMGLGDLRDVESAPGGREKSGRSYVAHL